jgi:hypothetical protein
MLSVSGEHGVNRTDCTLNVIRHKNIVCFTPHSFDEFGVSFRKLTLCSQRIRTINLVLEIALQEVIS